MKQTTGHPRKWAILFAVTSALALIFLDATVLPVSLPTIQRDLLTSDVQLQWILNSYLLALTVFVLAGGRLCEIIGQKRVYLIGLIIFALSSAAAALSQTAFLLIVSRIFQGIGGAFSAPAAGLILYSVFPQQQRGRAVGFYVSIGSLFLAMGPTLGGVLSEYASWRYIFWLNLPVAVVGWILATIYIPESKKRKETFDYLGFLCLGGGVSLIITALMESPGWGWRSLLFWGMIVAGIALIVLLFLIPKRRYPIIDLALFKIPLFGNGIACMMFVQISLMVTVFWAIYLQTVLLYTPLQAGLLCLISNAPIIFFGPIAGHWVDRHGPRVVVCLGFVLIIFSLIWFVYFPRPKDVWELLPILFPLGCGTPLIFTPSFVTSLHEVTESHRGQAMGIYNMLRQSAATLGLAIMSMVFINTRDHQFAADLKTNMATQNLDPMVFEGMLTRTSEALQALALLTPTVRDQVIFFFTDAYLTAFKSVNVIGVWFGIAGLIVAFFTLRHYRTDP